MQVWTTSQLTPGVASLTIRAVPKPYTPTTYRKAFVQRVKAARIRSGKTSQDVAHSLGIPKDTYLRYETRTLLPHHLVAAFCQLTGEEVTWLVTGARLRHDGDPDSELARRFA